MYGFYYFLFKVNLKRSIINLYLIHKKYVAHIFAKFEYFLEEVKKYLNSENKTIYYNVWFKEGGNFIDYNYKVIYIDARTFLIIIFGYSICKFAEVEKIIKFIRKDLKRFNVTKNSPDELKKTIDELYIKLANKSYNYVFL